MLGELSAYRCTPWGAMMQVELVLTESPKAIIYSCSALCVLSSASMHAGAFMALRLCWCLPTLLTLTMPPGAW